MAGGHDNACGRAGALWGIAKVLGGCIAVGGIVLAVQIKLRKGPKGYTEIEKEFKVEKRVTDISRDAFKVRKVPKDIDYVVVGSGLGSLYSAALLAKTGKKVVVVEQHYVTGGCTHCFQDKGFEFDTGLHYVGRIEKYKKLLDLVSGDHKVNWARMGTEEDKYCYDEIQLGDEKPFHFQAGKDNFKAALLEEFPEEEKAINEYLGLVEKANKSADLYFFGKLFHPWVQWFIYRFLCSEFFGFAQQTTAEVLSGLTDNKRLKAILCGQFGNYGLIPEHSSFFMHAGVVCHYMDGGYYPIGGSQEISRAIIPTIEAAGGRVFVKAPVERIIVDEKSGKATGVLMDASVGKNVVLTAKHGVISGVGAIATERLLEDKDKPKLGYGEIFSKLKPGMSHVMLFIGLDGTSKELGLTGSNLWHLPVDSDYNFKAVGLVRDDESGKKSNPWEDQDAKDMLLFIGFPSAKDPSFEERFPGKATCEVITQCPPEWFEEYISTENKKYNKSGARKNASYSKLKEGVQEKIMKRFYQLYPQCQGRVAFIETGTPLSNQYYLGRPDSYGLEHTPERYGKAMGNLRMQTKIPNLFVTGQDASTTGIAGAILGGILTAHAVLGYGVLDLVLFKRNLIEDIMMLDSDKTQVHP